MQNNGKIYLSSRSGILGNSKKEYVAVIIKLILIGILSVPLICITLIWGYTRFFVLSDKPSDELENVITFINDKQYIGMSVEECKEELGEPIGIKTGEYVIFSAGYFQKGVSERYELYVYLDENERVKAVRLKEEIGD